MSERSHLINGRFWNDLNGWTVSGAVYNAGDGDSHYGVAVIGTGGDYLEQNFAVYDARVYTVQLSAKSTTGFSGSEIQMIILDGNGNTVTTQNVAITAGTWTNNLFSVGLVPGTNYTVKIINNSAGEDVKIDDVFIWFIPITREEIAERVADKISGFATDQDYTTTIDGAKTEGDFTFSVDAGLRSVNAINPETGLPDVRYLDPDDVPAVLRAAEIDILEKLQNEFALLPDITTGPITTRYSQVGAAIEKRTGAGSQGKTAGRPGRVEVRKIKRS